MSALTRRVPLLQHSKSRESPFCFRCESQRKKKQEGPVPCLREGGVRSLPSCLVVAWFLLWTWKNWNNKTGERYLCSVLGRRFWFWREMIVAVSSLSSSLNVCERTVIYRPKKHKSHLIKHRYYTLMEGTDMLTHLLMHFISASSYFYVLCVITRGMAFILYI